MYWVVEFHADGGVTCVYGRRTFTDPVTAGRFAKRMKSEPGHTCDHESVKEYLSFVDRGDYGVIRYHLAPNQI